MAKTEKSRSAGNPTVSTETLCALTGYTERHLRDLAKAGWFPRPDRGQYQSAATIKGIINYLKEQVAKKDDTEKKARAAYWDTKRKREAFDFAQEQGKFVPLAQLEPTLKNVLVHHATALRRKLELELPARLRSKTEIEMREELKAAIDELFKIFRDGVAQWLS
jgi:hypothetical protein